MEFFGWREFTNPRQVGALSGLVGSPFASGESDRELGITKAGNRHIRAMAIEIASCWLRFQPRASLRNGTSVDSQTAAGEYARSGLWRLHGACWSNRGATSKRADRLRGHCSKRKSARRDIRWQVRA
jgi:hypothetical protein